MKNISQNSMHCCTTMSISIKDKETPLIYNSIFREYNLDLGDILRRRIDYCPWCSNKLPLSLRDKFFQVVENELGIEDGILEVFDNRELPEEFKSDAWWKKRKL